jgi:hypothetical protein
MFGRNPRRNSRQNNRRNPRRNPRQNNEGIPAYQLYEEINNSIEYLDRISHSDEVFDPTQLSEHVLYKISNTNQNELTFNTNSGRTITYESEHDTGLIHSVNKMINGVQRTIFLYITTANYFYDDYIAFMVYEEIRREEEQEEARARAQAIHEEFLNAPGGPGVPRQPNGTRGGRHSNKKRTRRNHKNKKHRKSNKGR